jgi:stress-induced morphogen
MVRPVLTSPDDVCAALRERIAQTIEDAQIDVRANSPGHFQISVVSKAFAGTSRVQQQQLVYGAIKDLMAGDDAPVHAIDRLDTKTPA